MISNKNIFHIDVTLLALLKKKIKKCKKNIVNMFENDLSAKFLKFWHFKFLLAQYFYFKHFNYAFLNFI